MADTIVLKGVSEIVRIPSDYATIQDLWVPLANAKGLAVRYLYAALIGLCVPEVGRMCKVSFADNGFAALPYGRDVFSWLHAQGVPSAEIDKAGAMLYGRVLAAAFPGDAEVKAELGKSPAAEDGKTGLR